MTVWRTFNIEVKDFRTKKEYEAYRLLCVCGLCHERLENGDEFDLRAIQTKEEMKKFNDSSYNSRAVIVHRKCVEK